MARKNYIEDSYDFDKLLKVQKQKHKKKKKIDRTKVSFELSRQMFVIASVVILFSAGGIFYFLSGDSKNSIETSSNGVIENMQTIEEIQAGQNTNKISLHENNIVIEDEIIDNSDFIKSQIQIYDNVDIKAYMYIINSVSQMNFGSPLAQTFNNTYYLDHNLYKELDKNGAIFVDYNNSLYDTSKNLVIYGSNQFEGANLYTIKNYSDKSFYDANKIIKIVLDDRIVYYEVFAFCEVEGSFKPEPTSFATEQGFNNYISSIKNSSKYFEEVASNDNIITITTTSNSSDGVRYKLYGKRINKIN